MVLVYMYIILKHSQQNLFLSETCTDLTIVLVLVYMYLISKHSQHNLFLSETCTEEEFHCARHQPKCIPSTEVCNGNNDCVDGSDEVNCTSSTCPHFKYTCTNKKQCIYKNWVCDGERDCTDGSDEINCTRTTSKCTEEERSLPLYVKKLRGGE